MAREVVNDWVLELGFDDKAVIRGLRKTENRLRRLNNIAAKAGKNATAGVDSRIRAEKRITTAQETEIKKRVKNAEKEVTASQRFTQRRGLRNLGNRITGSSISSGRKQELMEQVSSIRSQLRKVRTPQGMRRLIIAMDDLKAKTARYNREATKTNRVLVKQALAARTVSGAFVTMGGSIAGAYAAFRAGTFLFNTLRTFDSLNASLLAASGSARQAGEDFEFIRKTSKHLGVDLEQATRGYNQIGAASRFAGLSTDEGKKAFLAATEASRAFGLSAERTGLVYLAFSQIISKGRVSQEELRRQMGEQLPGVMGIAAKSMNTTTEGFEEMLRSGLDATEFLPKFSVSLREAARAGGALSASMNSIEAQVNRFNTSTAEFALEFGDAGGRDAIAELIGASSSLVDSVGPFGATLGRIGSLLLRLLSLAVRVIEPFAKVLFTVLDTVVELGLMLFDVGTDGTQSIDALTGSFRELKTILGPVATFLDSISRIVAGITGGLFTMLDVVSEFANTLVLLKQGAGLGDAFGALRDRVIFSATGDEFFSDRAAAVEKSVIMQVTNDIKSNDTDAIKVEVENVMQDAFKTAVSAGG